MCTEAALSVVDTWWSSTQLLFYYLPCSAFSLNCFVLINYDDFDPLEAMGRSAV